MKWCAKKVGHPLTNKAKRKVFKSGLGQQRGVI